MSRGAPCGAVVGSRSASTEFASVSRVKRTSSLLRACRADRSSEGRRVKKVSKADMISARGSASSNLGEGGEHRRILRLLIGSRLLRRRRMRRALLNSLARLPPPKRMRARLQRLPRAAIHFCGSPRPESRAQNLRNLAPRIYRELFHPSGERARWSSSRLSAPRRCTIRGHSLISLLRSCSLATLYGVDQMLRWRPPDEAAAELEGDRSRCARPGEARPLLGCSCGATVGSSRTNKPL